MKRLLLISNNNKKLSDIMSDVYDMEYGGGEKYKIIKNNKAQIILGICYRKALPRSKDAGHRPS